MTDAELDAIEARAKDECRYAKSMDYTTEGVVCNDIPALVAEVRRLRETINQPRLVAECAKCGGGITDTTINVATGALVCMDCDPIVDDF